MKRRRLVIMGAAGRDFHNFNVAFRDDPTVEVVAFTATQVPYISGRRYPAILAGPQYPNGIEIVDESELESLLRDREVEEVIFAYSDVSHEYVMHRASSALAEGADFRLMGPRSTMLRATIPVVSVCAVRTGSGKSQTSRKAARILAAAGARPVVVRHPMAYGDLAKQTVQRFSSLHDLESSGCTIEEREEYEPHITEGRIVYSGIDFAAILERAQSEAGVILWDGGNNDFPFFRPDLHIVVADPLRPGHETTYHPGETNLRMADAVIINKVDSAEKEDVESIAQAVRRVNPRATITMARSLVMVEGGGEQIRGKKVLVIEDGPTLTHGEMKFGAGVVAARRWGAEEIVDPRNWVSASLTSIYEQYKVGPVLPAMGYRREQLEEMESVIRSTPADLVLVATPVDLSKILSISKPALRVSYELDEVSGPTLEEILANITASIG